MVLQMNLYLYLASLIVLFIRTSFAEDKEVNSDDKHLKVIKIKNGYIQGRFDTTKGKHHVYTAFQGIPYAEPPVGALRFKYPAPKQPWNGILKTTQDANMCVQGRKNVLGNEDCLYLNVFAPHLKDGPLAVMVYIYGGAFMAGVSTYATTAPDYLLEDGVIVVTLNYRTGIMGFLSTGELSAPGNNGLWDQLLALKWIKDNIEFFNGDPNRITIFGESAGAASVSYHLQSSQSRGYFHGAIMESGNSLCLWALARRQSQVLYKLAILLGLPFNDTQNFVDALRKIPANTLHKLSMDIAVELFITENPRSGLLFGPVSEPDHPDAFFRGNSHEMLKNGNFATVPIMVGFNSMEISVDIIEPLMSFLMRSDMHHDELTPIDMNISKFEDKLKIGNYIALHYFGNKPLHTQKDKVLEFASDDQFNRPTREIVKLLSKKVETYFYRFSYKGPIAGNHTTPGVTHGEELAYIWYQNKTEGQPMDYLIKDQMVKMWTNFAKYKDPTPTTSAKLLTKWYPSTGPHLPYLNINVTTEMQNSNTENLDYWENLYEKYGTPPFDTY